MRNVLAAGVLQAKTEGVFLAKVCFVVLVFGLVFIQPLQRAYDEYLRPVPFMTATVELVDDGGPIPAVRYAARAPIKLTGSWSAWIEVNGKRGCNGSGPAGYGPPIKDPRLWDFHTWLGAQCAVPIVPFAVCVRYSVETDTGVGNISGPFCSPVYDPTRRK